MKTVVAAIITCLALFGASVGTTKFFLDKGVVKDDADAAPQNPPTPSSTDELKPALQMPVSLRPESAVSLEAVLQMSDSIKQMEQQLIEREQRLIKKEQRVKLLFDDLVTEQEELRAFSEGIDAKVDMLSAMTSTLERTLDDLEARKVELEKLAKQTGSDKASQLQEFDNKVNDVKGWFANLDADQAADYLKEFANNGKLEFAASLLHKMPDRQTTKILGAMSDPVLVEQLIDSLNVLPKRQ